MVKQGLGFMIFDAFLGICGMLWAFFKAGWPFLIFFVGVLVVRFARRAVRK